MPVDSDSVACTKFLTSCLLFLFFSFYFFCLFFFFSTETLYLTALGPKSLHPWREKREKQCGESVSLDIAS